jgi:hypothetical protein
MTFLVLLGLFLCVQVAFGRWGHHQHHKPPSDSNPLCHFQTDKGSYDLRLLVRDMNNKDWELRDEKLKATFFFNPCGSVHNTECPEGSALCEITEKNIAIDFGRAENLTWAEAQDAGVELSYSSGEPCANDVPRKTLVQLSCSKPTADKQTHRTVITDLTIDECLVTLKVSSPYGCPVEELCTVFDKKECEASEGLCGWAKGDKCVHTSTSCFAWGKHHIPIMSLLAIFIGTGLVAFFSCTVCVCACRRRRRNQKAVLPTTKKSKKASKKVVEEEVEQQIPEPQFIYQPMQQYPGQQYGQGFAYPMVQFVPTTIQNE